ARAAAVAGRAAGHAHGLGGQGHVRRRAALGHDRHRRRGGCRHHRLRRVAEGAQVHLPRAGAGGRDRHLPADRTDGADLPRRRRRLDGGEPPRRASARRGRARPHPSPGHAVRRRPDHRRGPDGHRDRGADRGDRAGRRAGGGRVAALQPVGRPGRALGRGPAAVPHRDPPGGHPRRAGGAGPALRGRSGLRGRRPCVGIPPPAGGGGTFRLCAPGRARLPSGPFRQEPRPMPRTALLTLCLLAAMPSLADARGLEARDLASLERVSSPTLSPDGRQLVFARRTIDLEANSGTTALYLRNLVTRDMAPPRRLTPEGWNVNSPAFSPDGRTVYFLSAKGGSQQLYAIPVEGGEPRQLTAFATDVGTYHVSPDGARVAFSAATFADCGADFACTRKRFEERKADKATGVVYDQLFVRHWDTWADGTRNRLFVAELPGAGAAPVA